MTHPTETTIRAPWLHGVRRQEATQARRAPSFSPVLPARWRRALGVAMTSAGVGTIVMSAAEVAANLALAPVGQLLIVVLSTAGVVYCTVAGDGGDSR